MQRFRAEFNAMPKVKQDKMRAELEKIMHEEANAS